MLPDVDNLFRLDGRVAIVTGASAGLGDRFTRVLVAAGASVVAAARRADRLSALADDCGDAVVPVPCDLSSSDDVAALVDVALARFGRVDVLVNNAGTSVIKAAEDETLDEFRSVLDVNLIGLFALTQLVGRSMIAAGSGSVINISSVLGFVAGTPIKQASYCASKGAVVNLTRELAVQWARKGVRVNGIAPGWFPSEMTANMVGDERSEAFVRDNAPMARFGRVDELDGALLFLASDASSYVTGQTILVDGGWTAR